MEIGLIVKYGKLVPGRELQAFELFAESRRFFDEQLKLGFITYYEPFFYVSGDFEAEAGFWIIKGDREKLWKLVEGETYRWLLTKATFVLDHLEVEWLTAGEGIAEQLERSSKAAAEFASVH
ncbi:MAG TPA: hypothetical protein VFA45_04945 [Actinomycetes bacterium]|jgi:hypothetical protein|nr:hypothetical protein [Actinomycetes bacterium]